MTTDARSRDGHRAGAGAVRGGAVRSWPIARRSPGRCVWPWVLPPTRGVPQSPDKYKGQLFASVGYETGSSLERRLSTTGIKPGHGVASRS